jgi:hypothetical protein
MLITSLNDAQKDQKKQHQTLNILAKKKVQNKVTTKNEVTFLVSDMWIMEFKHFQAWHTLY